MSDALTITTVPQSTIRVLIVGDNDEQLRSLEASLTADGAEVITARDGAEALVKAPHTDLDAVISNLYVPVMEGCNLLKQWKSNAQLSQIPFVVYAASDRVAEDAPQTLNSGADAFILNPVEPEELLARLRALRSARTPSPSTASPSDWGSDFKKRQILRDNEPSGDEAGRQLADSQTAILDALPAHIALINVEGQIEWVNQSWSCFEGADCLSGRAFVIGQNYLEACYQANPSGLEEAQGVANSIRAVLNGQCEASCMEYCCHSWNGHRWFRMTVTPIQRESHAGAVVMHLDITERRKAEEVLQRREKEQRLLAEQLKAEHTRLVNAQKVARMGSWETDISSFSVLWSDETHQIFETDPASFRPTHAAFLALVHPEDRTAVDTVFIRSLKLCEAQEIEHRILLPNGRTKFVIERWQVFHNERGVPLSAVGTTQDITDRKLVEEEIRRMTELLWAVADGIPDAVFVKDVDGRYLLCNEGAAKLVGKAVAEILGRDDFAIFGPEEAKKVMANDREVIASGKTCTAEEVLTAAGVTRTYLATKAPYRDDQGKLIGIIGISRDISERKQAEIKIHEQATFLDKAQDAIVVRALDHTILYWNRSAERLYGWTADEALGRSVMELLYQDPAQFIAATNTTVESGEWFGEIQQFNRQGSPLTIEGRWTLVCDDEGRPKSVLSINTDITERKKLEQQFLRTQRMESIGTLAGGIAHDLNNVLAPILMSIGMLRMQEQDARKLEILATIESSAKRGAEMVGKVLSFARGMEGRQVQVDPEHLLREIERIANVTFLKSIRVSCEVPSNLWTVTGDPTQLHQVLLNLCLNARDAMPDGGTLAMSASNVTIDEQYAGMNLEAKPGPHVCFEIEDSGAGMSSEVKERIFEPFFTTKEFGHGTGLGLSTALAIIKSHGGFIHVNSELGTGARFRVFVPAKRETALPTATMEVAQLLRGAGELVLVVDDEEAVRQITRQTLEAYGYTVVLASDGAEAVALYAAQRDTIEVVITDMMMPLMDGPSTIQVLLRINPQVRIIAASGLNTHHMVAKAVGAGIKHFIPKPYSAETLLSTVRDALAN